MTERTEPEQPATFLADPEPTPVVQALYDEDLREDGYVWNVSRLWAYQPVMLERLFGVMSEAFHDSGLDFRHRALLVLAAARERGDAYCSLAWGEKLAHKDGATGAATAAAVSADDGTGPAGLAPAEAALVTWTRAMLRDPNATTPADVQRLRDAGFDDRQIFAVTVFATLRHAFSTVNDALGAAPDLALADRVPEAVRAAVTFGRPPARVKAPTAGSTSGSAA